MTAVEITNCLFLSSATAARREKIRTLGITQVINVTLEVPNLQLPNLDYMQIPIDDSPNARLGVHFDKCADKIDQVDKKGGRTLVHCLAGISRSASVCIAYLMKYQRLTLEQAYHHVKIRRSVIHPNEGFWRQLIDYERHLFGQSSVKMVQSTRGWVPDVYLQETKTRMSYPPKNSSQFHYC